MGFLWQQGWGGRDGGVKSVSVWTERTAMGLWCQCRHSCSLIRKELIFLEEKNSGWNLVLSNASTSVNREEMAEHKPPVSL